MKKAYVRLLLWALSSPVDESAEDDAAAKPALRGHTRSPG